MALRARERGRPGPDGGAVRDLDTEEGQFDALWALAHQYWTTGADPAAALASLDLLH